MGIIRKQLNNFGATPYLSSRLTKGLEPIGRQGRAYEYNTKQVLQSIRNLMASPKTRKTTKAVLARLEGKVSSLVENTTNDERLRAAMQAASVANARFEETASGTRKIAQEFQEHKRKRGLNFSSRNNIVTFTS